MWFWTSSEFVRIFNDIYFHRLFGIVVIDDNEKAWFPANELKEFHGIVPHEVTPAETLLFCIRSDGTEGLCCPTYHSYDDDDEEIWDNNKCALIIVRQNGWKWK